MKRSRASSKSGVSDTSSKEEPPKKVKKRIKQAAPATSSTTIVATPPSTPGGSVVNQPSLSLPPKEKKLGSLPLYGEQLPVGGYDDIPGAAQRTCAQLKEVMTKVRELKRDNATAEDEKAKTDVAAYRQKGLVLFAGLKKFNRLSHLYCKDSREQTQEQKLEVDDIHLQLQNLMYESMHLKREINNCLEFKSQHEEIDLVSETEMYDTAPKSISKPEVTMSDEHQLMLSRLEWELEQRKQLASQRGDLEKSISQQKSEISKMAENLSGLQPTLESIRKATLPLQENLGLTLDKRRTENETAQLLPPPLYIFFMQIRTYADVQDPSISVSISGDVGEARAFKSSSSREQSDDDSGDSDTEAEEQRKKKRRRKGASSKSKATKEDASTPYPLAITVNVAVNDLGSFQITLTYLPLFGAVCASVTFLNLTGIPDAQASNLIEKSSLLHCLFEGDTGRTSPNSLVSYHIRKRGGDIFSSAVRQYGFPYKWVQRVCGIADNVESPESKQTEWLVEVSAESMERVVKVLRNRFKCQTYLSKQLLGLSSDDHTMDLGPDIEDLFPDPPSSKLTRWKPLSLSEVQATQFASVSVLNQQEKTNRFFVTTFQLNDARLLALVCLGVDYPATPPCIAVMTEIKGQKEVRGIQTKNIEAEVNLHFPKTIKDDKYGRYLLCKQLRRLQECFETYMEYRKATTKQKTKLIHKIKGRGRLLCFSDAS